MPFFSGFAGRFGEELARSRSEEADRQERQNALESSVLQHLSSSPDPEIASHAVTGLLDLASPQRKAKGLAGWLGKVGAHPALPTIRQLIQQGRQVEDQPAGVDSGPAGPPETLPGTPTGPLGAGLVPEAAGGAQRPSAVRPPLGPSESEEAPSGPAGPVATPSQPSAATPPPQFRPATTKTVPREVFLTPDAQAERTAGAHERGTLKARGDAYDEFKGDPAKQSLVPGVNNPPAPHAAGEWQDAQGNWFKQDVTVAADGSRTLTRTPISKAAPTSGEPGKEHERALEILATTPGMSPEAALQQARVEGRQATLAKVEATADAHTIRLGQIKAMVPATLAAWQRVNGTAPMTRAQAHTAASQALTAARTTLGAGPDVTPEDITRFADGLMSASDATRNGPKVSPIRAALAKPLAVDAQPPAAATPPPAPGAPATPGAPGALTDALASAGTGLEGASVHPRQYSAQGKQTMQALGTVEPMLQKLVEGIKAAGLQENNSITDEQINKLFYSIGISPGDIETQRLQLEGMSEAYGLRGLVGGRSNQVLQNIYRQHLVQPGDSPKFVIQKAEDLISILPMIRKAVDDAEGAQVGARGGGKKPAGAPAAAPPPGGPPTASAPAATAGAVPEAVKAVLKGLPAGKHTLSDGSVWVTDAAGAITKGG